MPPGELISVNKSHEEESTRGLAWDRVDFKKRIIIFEGECTKTEDCRSIPIADEINEILHSIPRNLSSAYVITCAGRPLSNIRGELRSVCKLQKSHLVKR